MAREGDGFLDSGFDGDIRVRSGSHSTRRGNFSWDYFASDIRVSNYLAYAHERADAGDLGAQIVEAVHGYCARQAALAGAIPDVHHEAWEDMSSADIDREEDAVHEHETQVGRQTFALLKRLDEQGFLGTMAALPELDKLLEPLIAEQKPSQPENLTRRSLLGRALTTGGLGLVVTSGSYGALRHLAGDFSIREKTAAVAGMTGGGVLAIGGQGISAKADDCRQYQFSFDFLGRALRTDLGLPEPAALANTPRSAAR